MIGMVILLSGCGHDQAVSTDVQAQTAEISDTTVRDSASPKAQEDSPAQESTESAQMNVAEERIKIDDETRQQLTAELLEENGMDASVVEPERSTSGCTFDLPEGFEESQEVKNLYVTARYPLDTSMIYYEIMDGDISLQLMTEEMFKEQAEEIFHRTYDADIEVDLDSYESMIIDGYPAFRIVCHYEADGIDITQLEYIINADKTYAITYSQTSDYDWMEAFKASAATIRVK